MATTSKKEETKEVAAKEPSLEQVIIALVSRSGPVTLSPAAMEEAKAKRLGIDRQDDGSVALEVT